MGSKDSEPDDKKREPEDEVREYLQGFLKWFEGGGAARKAGLATLLLGMASPFLLGLAAVIIVIVWILPLAVTFTERLAVFGVLFSLLTALSFQLARASERTIFGLYVLRRRRKKKASEPSE